MKIPKIPRQVSTKMLLTLLIISGMMYASFSYGMTIGSEATINSLNAQMPQITQELRNQGASLYEQQLVAQCLKSPEKSLTIACKPAENESKQ